MNVVVDNVSHGAGHHALSTAQKESFAPYLDADERYEGAAKPSVQPRA